MAAYRKLLPLLICLTSTGGAHAVVRRMFVTSVSGTGDLGSWPAAGPAVGIAAGDAICEARASAAGLANPSGYRAWLSDSADDAYCRIHGLAGKVAANCGKATLPAAAGPWRRTDGSDFGATITQLLSPTCEVFRSPRLTENGTTIHALVWTGTISLGTLGSFGSCGDWQSDSVGDLGAYGGTEYSGQEWTGLGGDTCEAPNHLFCFEIGAGDPLPPRTTWGRLAFVTAATGSGDLSSWSLAGGQTGLAAADAICRNSATAAGLASPESFKAWLSTATVDARDRFLDDGPWMRIDRVRIANDLADLTDGYLRAPLNVTETGVYLGSNLVFTGTDESGVAVPDRCNEWTSDASGDTGQTGAADGADLDWTFHDITLTGGSCSSLRSLYCLQDLPLVFADGFASGNAGAWSDVVP